MALNSLAFFRIVDISCIGIEYPNGLFGLHKRIPFVFLFIKDKISDFWGDDHSEKHKTNSEKFLAINHSLFGIIHFAIGIAALSGLANSRSICGDETFALVIVFAVFIVSGSTFQWFSICCFTEGKHNM